MLPPPHTHLLFSTTNRLNKRAKKLFWLICIYITKYNSLFFVLLYSWWIMSQACSWQVSPQFCLLHPLVTSVVISCLLTGYLCLCSFTMTTPSSHTGPICEGSCAMWPSCGCRGLQWPMCAVCVDCLLCPWTVTGLLSVSRRWPRGHGAQRGLSWWPLYWSLIWGWLTTPRDREKCVWALFWGDQIH